MNLVVISRVKNECDIIEAFVRHHAQHFQRIIVLDDGSTDGTYGILCSLQAQGLPLELLSEPDVGYNQSLHMTRLMRLAFDRFDAGWVVPLDADEFVEPPQGASLGQVLRDAGASAGVLVAHWNNFVWSSADDAEPEPNPVRRLRMRLPPQNPLLGKVLIPADAARGRECELLQGNHGLNIDGRRAAVETLEGVNICHFPVRGVAQYAGKIAMGYLQYRATPHWDGGSGHHYLPAFRALVEGLDQLAGTMQPASLRYSLVDGVPWPSQPRDAPLRYDGGPLTLTAPREDVMSGLLRFAEILAAQRALLLEREEDMLRGRAALESELAVLRAAVNARDVELSSRTVRMAWRIRDVCARTGLLAVVRRLFPPG